MERPHWGAFHTSKSLFLDVSVKCIPDNWDITLCFREGFYCRNASISWEDVSGKAALGE